LKRLVSNLRSVTSELAARPSVTLVRVWKRIDGEPRPRLIESQGGGAPADDALVDLPWEGVECWVASVTGDIVVAPIVVFDRTVGLLTVATRAAPTVEDRALARMASFAAAAVMAAADVVDLPDRQASEQLARGQLEVLTRTLDAVAMDSAPDRVIEHVLRTITEHLGAHSISILLRDETGTVSFECAYEGGRLVTKTDPALAGIDQRLPGDTRWPWIRVASTGRIEVMPDIRVMDPFPFRDRMIGLGIVTAVILPMMVGGRVGGLMGLRFPERRDFTTEQLDLAQALVNQATLVMELRRLSDQSLASALADERNRMARDVHDSLAQGFTGVIVQLEAATDAAATGLPAEAHAHIKKAVRLAREGLQEARRSVRALRPKELENRALPEAIAALVRKVTEGTAVRSQFVVNGARRELPLEWDANLLRIAQEVAANMLRHSRARRFEVEMTFGAAELRLDLLDDGEGFDPSAKRDGFGLLGIGERVEGMGGSLAIQSARGRGTTVSITLPLIDGGSS
jgi:signal transduction histidine kinase